MPTPPFQASSDTELPRALAWRAAIAGWWWGAMTIVGGVLWGVASDQGVLVVYHPMFWLWSAAMMALFFFTWRRIHESASLGMLNFTITRLGWMLVATVAWAALTAGPTGAYEEMFKSLTHLAAQPEYVQIQVIGALMLGQGFVVLAAICWIVLLVSMFVSRRPPGAGFGASLMSSVLLFCGLAFAFGAHSMGQLVSMAPRI